MLKSVFASCMMLFLSVCVFGQGPKLRPVDLVKSQNTFEKVDLFQLDDKRSATVTSEIKQYSLLSLKKENIEALLNTSSPNISLSLPRTAKKSIDLDLVEVELMNQGQYVTLAPSGEVVKVNAGKHYRGIVSGDESTVVAISVFDDQIMGLIAKGNNNLVLGKMEDSDSHILYLDNELKEHHKFECGTEDTYEPYAAHELKGHRGDLRAAGDCIKLYYEVDNDIYKNKGSSVSQVTNYISGLHNQVAAMYANENINVTMQPLKIWTSTSPYSGNSTLSLLGQFENQVQNGFDGNLAMLLTYQASGGIAYVNQLCSNNPRLRTGVSSIDSEYENVPTYSWSVMVVTHEFGHLFGSNHTHACVWNGNGTAIDGCYETEGGCSDPGNPSGGGTVMSYCHLTSVGINLTKGFGTQPGNVIRSRVANASCTESCNGGGGVTPTCNDGIQNGNETGVDCGGSCAPCNTGCNGTEVTLTLKFDNYASETSWQIKNAAGSVVESGSGYGNSDNGQTRTFNFCLPDGCYDFVINDSYGDGICCSYGQGSYSLTNGSTSLANGASFTRSETKNFCLGSVTPTCNDGVKNGSETGVDCGGPDCGPCVTCNDGVQNGSETGVDCGGPDCAPCATCNDGVQNGNETGVDCGGPDCAPCATCNDGVQNGNETGVDCGGPDCAPCATCNDGVKNGSETGVDCGGPDCAPCATCNDGVQNGNETGVDCGGDCAPCNTGCQGEEVTLTLKLDNYASETSWELKDANGSVVASGGTYSGQNNQTKTETFCLPAGCYDFIIKDSYGDGICCAYGQGNYELKSSTKTYASGGSFASSETKNFCIESSGGGGGGSTPTCNDGVKNGNETGVDCGGPDCAPCATCDDGVKNGDETGIDCGGSCAPCDNGGGGGNGEAIFAHYFESGWDGWTDGGSDCYRYSGSRSYEGNYSIRLRDNSGAGSTMTSSAYNLSSYGSVNFSFYFYPYSMEPGENFTVEFYNGSSWTQVYNGISGQNFQNNNNYEVNIPISSGLSSNNRFRITCDASSNTDQVYIDQVKLTAGGSSIVGTTLISSGPASTIASLEGYTLTPNPTSDRIYLNLNSETTYETGISVTDIMGKVVESRTIKIARGVNQVEIDASTYLSGTYFVRFADEEGEVSVEKFVKVN